MADDPRSEQAGRTAERARITENRPIIVERRSGGRGVFVLVIGLLALAVIGWFLMNMTRSEQVESSAVAEAARSVGDAAENVGEAAGPAVPDKN